MMSKFITIFLSTALLCLAVACGNDDDERPEYAAGLKVVKAQTLFGVLGGTQEVTLAAAPAQAYTKATWLKVEQKAENISLTAETNQSMESRNALLVLKNQQGDSIAINIHQEGISFGLPTGEEILIGDEQAKRSLLISANVPVEYGATQSWIKVSQQNGKLEVEIERNTTGKPHVGWLTATAAGIIDSLQVVQASLADVVGEYVQTALMRNENRDLVEKTTNVRIEAKGTRQANFIVDEKYVWEVAFTPGKGFEMKNGKVVSKKEIKPGVTEYLISVIVANDFSKEHETMINGTQESVSLGFDNEGNLVFRESQKLSNEQTFASYGWNRYTTNQPVQSAFQGIGEVYVQPKLTRKP